MKYIIRLLLQILLHVSPFPYTPDEHLNSFSLVPGYHENYSHNCIDCDNNQIRFKIAIGKRMVKSSY